MGKPVARLQVGRLARHRAGIEDSKNKLILNVLHPFLSQLASKLNRAETGI
jgi:hypothetical protein